MPFFHFLPLRKVYLCSYIIDWIRLVTFYNFRWRSCYEVNDKIDYLRNKSKSSQITVGFDPMLRIQQVEHHVHILPATLGKNEY